MSAILGLLLLLPLDASAAREFKLDPAVLGDIARRASVLPTEQAIEFTHAELRSRYGDHIAPARRWIFNDAGNVLLQITLLYCSTSEYLIFFNTPIGAGGYSGRYKKVEFWDFILGGRMQTFRAGQLEAVSTGPGGFGYMKKGEDLGFKLDENTTALEYGRGSVLSAFPFGVIAPARYFTLDWKSAWAQIHDCGKLALKRN